MMVRLELSTKNSGLERVVEMILVVVVEFF